MPLKGLFENRPRTIIWSWNLLSVIPLNPMISEKNPLKLGTNWCEATHRNWTETATVKIFSTKEEYEKFSLKTINWKLKTYNF